MKNKAIFVLDINYDPQIKAITLPLIQKYAEKIEADLIFLTERKYPEYSIECEKFQIYSYRDQYEWFIYIDLDAIVHQDAPDFTELIEPEEVLFGSVNYCGNSYRLNNWFRRDGRFIQAGNWFSICSYLTIDLWNPIFKYSQEQAEEMIFPTMREEACGITKQHLVDEFLVSCNIARFNLKLETVQDILLKLNIPEDVYFFHDYTVPKDKRAWLLNSILADWREKCKTYYNGKMG